MFKQSLSTVILMGSIFGGEVDDHGVPTCRDIDQFCEDTDAYCASKCTKIPFLSWKCQRVCQEGASKNYKNYVNASIVNSCLGKKIDTFDHSKIYKDFELFVREDILRDPDGSPSQQKRDEFRAILGQGRCLNIKDKIFDSRINFIVERDEQNK
jgi:hypothetical protein